MKNYAYLDIEATHSNWLDAQIIEIAFIIKDETGKDVDFFNSLIRPIGGIDKRISDLTGITNKMLENAPPLHQVAQKIYDKLQDTIIVAHKVSFDYELLQAEMSKLNYSLKNKKRCTLELTQKLIPGLKSYSLKSLGKLLQIKLNNHHRALDDVLALYELHRYLHMISGEVQHEERFLAEHKKLITKTPKRAGVIRIESDFPEKSVEVFKTDNLQQKLVDLLIISPKNKHRITQNIKIKIIPCASLIKAGLIKAKMEKAFYPYCVYQFKNAKGEIILKVGKTNLKKKALYYTKTFKNAEKIIKDVKKDSPTTTLIYKDANQDHSQVIKENIQLQKNIKKFAILNKNYLIRSSDRLDGKFQYTIIKSNKAYAVFDSEKLINCASELSAHKIKYRSIGPREYMSLTHSLQWIKNQKTKTDFILELKID